MSTKNNAWLKASLKLLQNPEAHVRCPACEFEFLAVRDVVYEVDTSLFSRYVSCSQCGRHDVFDRLKRSDHRMVDSQSLKGGERSEMVRRRLT